MQCICLGSNGLCFDIISQEQGVGLFERESCLHIAYRETPKLADIIKNAGDFERMMPSASVATTTVVTSAPLPIISAPVLKKENIESMEKNTSSGTTKRVLKEYTSLLRDGCENWQAWVGEDNLLAWKAIVEGPKGTPYADGRFLVTISFPTDYPFRAPSGIFFPLIKSFIS